MRYMRESTGHGGYSRIGALGLNRNYLPSRNFTSISRYIAFNDEIMKPNFKSYKNCKLKKKKL